MNLIVIRVDASNTMGSGHIMRCLTLANALSEQGCRSHFIVRHLPASLEDLIKQSGHECTRLPRADSTPDELPHSEWLGVSQADDAKATAQFIVQLDSKPDWLIVDHYALDIRWETLLRPLICRLMVIDDLADRHHDCDVLLDQNEYLDKASRYRELIPTHTPLALGARFALLRPEFKRLHTQVATRQGPVRNILIFFGGMDTHNYTAKVLSILPEVLIQLESSVEINVIIGSEHPDREYITRICDEQSYNLHIQTTKMAELMAAADMAIGAGGSASWERCSVGLPSLAFAVAHNQIQLTEDACLSGVLESPAVDWNSASSIKVAISAMIMNPLGRQRISQLGLAMVDGRGVDRILRLMDFHSCTLRKACQDDSEFIWNWRNHEKIRNVSRNQEVIPWENHKIWFDNTLKSHDRLLLIGEMHSLPIAVLRFDLINLQRAEISIFLDPESSIQGMAVELINAAEHHAKLFFSGLNEIVAVVLADNHASHALFHHAGFHRIETHYCKSI